MVELRAASRLLKMAEEGRAGGVGHARETAYIGTPLHGAWLRRTWRRHALGRPHSAKVKARRFALFPWLRCSSPRARVRCLRGPLGIFFCPVAIGCASFGLSSAPDSPDQFRETGAPARTRPNHGARIRCGSPTIGRCSREPSLSEAAALGAVSLRSTSRGCWAISNVAFRMQMSKAEGRSAASCCGRGGPR